MRRRRFWRPRVLVLVASLLGMQLAATVLVMAGARSTERYACLHFEDWLRGAPPVNSAPGVRHPLAVSWLLDVNTGQYMRDPRPVTRPPFGGPSGAYSPDGKYMAYLEYGASGTSGNILYVRESTTKRLIKIQVVSGAAFNFGWARDSSRMAFTWTDADQHTFLSIANPEGGDRYDQIIDTNDALELLFHGWAADGMYVALSTREQNTSERMLRIWSLAERRFSTLSTHETIFGEAWSPQGHRLAFLQTGQNTTYRLSLYIAGAAADLGFDLEGAVPPPRIIWSPDSLYVYLEFRSYGPDALRLGVYGLDGTELPNVGLLLKAVPRRTAEWANWTADGRAVVFLRELRGALNWTAFYPAQRRTQDILTDVIKGPFHSSGGRLMFVARNPLTGKNVIETMDLDGANRATLVSGTDDQGDPYWSPGGSYAAVVWATGQGSGRLVRLTWARADGSSRQTLDDGFWDVRDLQWLSDGKSLAYIVWKNARFSLEVADLASGSRRALSGQLAEIVDLRQDTPTGQIRFWWRGLDGSAGVEAVTPEGKLVFRYRAAAPITPAGAKLFQAPSNVGVGPGALKFGPRGDESLVLAAPDGGESRFVRAGLSGLGDPLWAPDGTRLAFTQAVNRGPVTLEIVTANGSEVRRLERFGGTYLNLTWTKCD